MAIAYKTIIAAIDPDDDLCDIVLKTAQDLATQNGATLHLMDAAPAMAAISSPYAMGSLPSEAAATEADFKRREKALSELADNSPAGTVYKMATGDASLSVTDYAREIDADLIVTGSHQKGWWKTLVVGSESQDIVREAPCAVFVVTASHRDRLKKLQG